MYSTLVIIILGCSTTTLLHLPIYKHKSVPSTSLLALHRLHSLLPPHLFLLMIKSLLISGTTIHYYHIFSRKCYDLAAAHEICMDFRRKVATYSESDFRVNTFIADTSFPLARHVGGSHNTRSLTVLGWTDDIKILNATLYPVHVQNNSPDFMTALYNIGRLWLGAATILSPKHMYDPD